MNLEYPHVIELEYITLRFYKHYVVSTIQEGVFFDLPQLDRVIEEFRAFYPEERPFASIADRKNDYTINPTCFFHSDILPNLVCIGVVCHSENSYEIANFERKFYQGSFEVFRSMETCVAWTKKRVAEFKENAGL